MGRAILGAIVGYVALVIVVIGSLQLERPMQFGVEVGGDSLHATF